jgi:hypothetical protein
MIISVKISVIRENSAVAMRVFQAVAFSERLLGPYSHMPGSIKSRLGIDIFSRENSKVIPHHLHSVEDVR